MQGLKLLKKWPSPSRAEGFFFVAGGSLGGRGALELGQGQAAAFRSLAKRPLTQRRGDTLGRGSKGGSIALTAMQTGV